MSNEERFAAMNPADVDKALSKKYDTRGPRYTSYPTAPHFSADFDKASLIQRWVEGNEKGGGLSAYIHIPYCQKRCLFCGCFTNVAKDPATADPYLDDLYLEFELLAKIIDPKRPIKQLAMGGGTPLFLTPDRLDTMLTKFEAHFSFAPDAEKSIEIDPRTILPEHQDVLFEHGFNRFSLGVQDLDETVQKAIGREQPEEKIASLVEAFKTAGREAINFDLIYGLAGQTKESFARTAKRVAEYAPSRIACYSYAHVPWMKGHQKVLEKYKLPGAEEKLAIFGAAFRQFEQAGYIPIGMDHFAKESDSLAIALKERTLHRNFMGYTTNRGLDLIAFGVSAISSVNNTYAQNTKDFQTYHEALAKKSPAFERGYLLSEEDSLRRELIIDLFCNFHLDILSFEKTWGIDFKAHFKEELLQLTPFIEDKLVTFDDEAIKVTALGRVFIRNLCMLFDAYLEQDPALRRYSKTV